MAQNSRTALGQQDLLFQKEPSCSVQFLELAAKSLHMPGSGMSPHTVAMGASQALLLSAAGCGIYGILPRTQGRMGCGIHLEPRAG